MRSDELDLPKSRSARNAKAARLEVGRFFKLAWALSRHIKTMHKESRDAISAAAFSRGLLNISTIGLDEFEHATLRMAMAAFIAAEDFPDSLPVSKRPTKAYAGAVADKCAELFLSLTGRMPTVNVNIETHKAHGPFLDFLDGIFEAFEIKASSEATGRAAIARMKEQHGPALVRIDPKPMEKKLGKSPK